MCLWQRKKPEAKLETRELMVKLSCDLFSHDEPRAFINWGKESAYTEVGT